MFLLGHLGIGSRMGRPFTAENCRAALYLGCVLPDLIDKPLYYGLSFATGKHAAELGLISSTRTFGHSLLFAIACYALTRGPRGRALFVGMLTHLVLDLGGDLWGRGLEALGWSSEQLYQAGPSTWSAVFFPFLGPHFPILPFRTIAEHASSLTNSYVLCGELVGGVLLCFDWRAHRRKRAALAQAAVSGSAAPL